MFTQTVPLAESEELDATVPGDTLPARGLAKEFDSMAATMRLASRTGALQPGADGAAGKHAEDDSEHRWGEATVMRAPPWSQRERRRFVGAVLGAVGVGALIVFY